jgi:arylsulfatase A-like enzyme
MIRSVKAMLPLSRAAVLGALLCILVVTAQPVSARDGDLLELARPSVLFINVDDWNDWNQVLRGHPQAITPHIDRLAKKGVTFSNAICASPVCFPSRTALFSGIRPAGSGCISNFNWLNSWRTYVPNAVTLPKHLAHHGWRTIGIAKNFHNKNDTEFGEYIGRTKEPRKVPGTGIRLNPSGHWAVADVPVNEMHDYISVSRGIERIRKSHGTLFLSLGIFRPHVPWVVPQEYFDKYPLQDLQLPERRANDLDDLSERFKLLAHNEAKFGRDYNKKVVAAGHDKDFVRAYLACVTFADEQLGRLLDAWEARPHAATGYIVLWSDHGFMLGEKEGWSKMKPWYDSARSNLIIVGPGIRKDAVCDKAVSLQDIYPTLIDLLKVPSPSQKLDGNSLLPLLRDPDADWDKPVVMSHEADGIRYDVVLDNDYRMTRLITGETELYKLADDPHEFNNLAQNPEYAPVIARLSKHLTFRYPEFTAGDWIEAEDTPRQTSSDYELRGNCHYPQPLPGASGGQVICADLRAGTGSYIDFVLDVQTPGTYSLAATLSVGGSSTVFVDDVVDDAAQADTGYPMKTVGRVEPATGGLKDVSIGIVTFDQPGLKLIRFMSNVPKQQLQIDRIQFLKGDQSPYPKADAAPPKTEVSKESDSDAAKQRAKRKAGRSRKTSWDSQEEWNRDKPTVKWVFPFIDENCDGKIDSVEYQAIQDYKKKHRDWQKRARMELGIERPQDGPKQPVNKHGYLYIVHIPADGNPPETRIDRAIAKAPNRYPMRAFALSKFAPTGGEPIWSQPWDGDHGMGFIPPNPHCICSTHRVNQALDDNGYIYMATKYSVQVIDTETGKVVGEFGSYGNVDCKGKGSKYPHPELPFGSISSLTVWKGKLFVMDVLNRRLVKCNITYDPALKIAK